MVLATLNEPRHVSFTRSSHFFAVLVIHDNGSGSSLGNIWLGSHRVCLGVLFLVIDPSKFWLSAAGHCQHDEFIPCTNAECLCRALFPLEERRGYIPIPELGYPQLDQGAS